MTSDERDHETDISITSDGMGTYTLVCGHNTRYGLTLDDCMAIISGKEIENE